MKYCIAVDEILRTEIVVDAESYDEAEDKVRDAYRDAKIVLLPDDYSYTDFHQADWYSQEEIDKLPLDDI